MKRIYAAGAEILFIIHFGIVIFAMFVGVLINELLWVYTVLGAGGLLSWLVSGRCILTTFENWLRKKSGQGIESFKDSYVGYWGKRWFNNKAPSNTFIANAIAVYYIFVTPFIVWHVYLEFFG